ncbi:MAG TPA: alpha/beta hydrolase [Chloroflexota bacterium]|jgi:acetyl esterase/lipase|nr:alpha/beta hydrolase [Chloroflexota bacterium]
MATTIDYEVSVQDVEFQQLGGKAWLARIYQPKGPGPFPTMLDAHGGAWHNGDRTNDVAINTALAAKGILVAAIDFRQPPEAGYPASVQDVNLGVRWLKANAGKFNGKTKVGSIGVSSGGHLVVLEGVRPRDSRYAALAGPAGVDATVDYVVACWPVIDPLYRYKHAQKGNRQDLIDAHLEYFGNEEAMAEAAPQTAVEKDAEVALPPVLMMLKEGDDNHPFPMQEAFMNAYKKRGGTVEMAMFKTTTAAPGLKPDEPEWGRVIETITEFARRFG